MRILLLLVAFLAIISSIWAWQIKSVQTLKHQSQILASGKSQNCNLTHFQFILPNSFSKTDYLNKTFTEINRKLSILQNVTYQPQNSSFLYSIYNIRPELTQSTFRKLEAELLGNDTILIENGVIDVGIRFNFSIGNGSYTSYGQGFTTGVSQEMPFALKIKFEDNNPIYSYYESLSFRVSQFMLYDISAWVTIDQKVNIIKMLNYVGNQASLREQLENSVNKLYVDGLKACIDQDNKRMGNHYSYKWVSQTTGEHVINFTRRPGMWYSNKDGFQYGYETTIDNFANNRCGPEVPKDTWEYTSLSFITYTFYENLLRYSAQKGILDARINRQLWNQQFFNYTARQLNNVFNNTLRFYPGSELSGYCKPVPESVKVREAEQYIHLRTLFTYNCEFEIENTKIWAFQAQLDFVSVIANYYNRDWKFNSIKVVNYDVDWKRNDKIIPGFEILDKDKLDSWFEISFHQLQELFGTGFPYYQGLQNPDYRSDDGFSRIRWV